MTGRGRRGNRSASREVSSPPAARVSSASQIATRRSTRNIKTASPDLDEIQNEAPSRHGSRQTSVKSTGSTRRITRKQSRAASPDLTTVEEVQESHSADEEAEDAEGDAEDDAEDDEAVGESTRGLLDRSGITTLQTRSHSQQDIEELDPSMMLMILPDLRNEALQIITLLTAENNPVSEVMQQVRMPRSRYAILLNKREKSFQESREYYGLDDYYINCDYVVRAFSGGKPDAEILGIQPVLQAANLAILVKKIIVTSIDDQGAVDMLQNLDGVFPTPFAGDMEQTELHDEIFSLGLSIRTQATISVLQKHSEQINFDPDEILVQMFFEIPEQSDEKTISLEHAMLNRELLKIAGADVSSSNSSKKSIIERIDNIRAHFFENTQAQAERYVDFAALQENFPWAQFVADLAKWARLRTYEIEAIVRKNGGIESIIESVEVKLAGKDREDETNIDFASPVPSLNFTSTTNNRRGGNEDNARSSIRTLYKGPNSVRTMIGSYLISASSLQTPNDRAHIPATLPVRITDNMGEKPTRQDSRTFAKWTAAKEAIKTRKTKGDERDKENRQPTERKRLVDRQAGAERMEFTEDSQMTSVRLTQKRPTPMSESESESGSEFYEEDIRTEPIRQHASPQRRRRTVMQEADGVTLVMQRNAKPLRPEEPQGSASTDIEEEENPRFTYTEINHKSKERARSFASPPTQQRVFWTEVECEQLVELIGEYGSNWASIARKGNFHHNRGQVGLKDKARNMKVDYLRCGAPLPMGFNSVALGKKEIEKVKAAGRNPYRLEGEAVGNESHDFYGNEII